MIAKRLASLLIAASLTFGAAARADDALVFAAASLKPALDAIAADFAKRSGHKAVIYYGGSSALAKQIAAGAPAEIFISADEDWMDYLAEKNLIDQSSRKDLLGNALVLIAPADGKIALKIAPGFALADALGSGRLAVGEVKSVPAGKYAKAALETLGVFAAVEPKLAPVENVRAALALVARGETPLGIVYATDAASEPGVRVVDVFPAGSHPPIRYPVALLTAAKAPARDFLAYLGVPAATAVFRARGFGILGQ